MLKHDEHNVVPLEEFDTNVPYLVYDIETNGLLPRLNKLTSLCLINPKGQILSCADQPGYTPIMAGLRVLAHAKIAIAHNGIRFDGPAIRKVYPKFRFRGQHLDTLILSRIIYPDIYKNGPNNSLIPGHLVARHSVESWGARLNLPKDDYKEIRKQELLDEGYTEDEIKEGQLIWEHWSPTLQIYCQQDCVVGLRIFKFLWSRRESENFAGTMTLEHDFAELIRGQVDRGFAFDMDAALDLSNTLEQRLIVVEEKLIDMFGSWWRVKKANNVGPDGVVVPKRTTRTKLKDFDHDITIRRFSPKTGKELKPYVGPPIQTVVEGCPYVPIYRHTFNPGSRADCILVLKEKYGWRPSKFTETGAAKLDEAVLLELKEELPAAELLIDYFMLTKRLGQLSTGKQAWIKKAKQEDTGTWRIHGNVNTLGAQTTRCTHSDPNLAQVPNANAPYGPECRGVFIPTPGMLLAGSDGDACQLRMLGHHLAPYDDGEYARAVDEGKKEDGTDAHSWFRDRIGTDLFGEGEAGRGKAKTTRYALLFGAGAPKLGRTAKPGCSPKQAIEIGKAIKERIKIELPAEFELSERVKNEAMETGYVVGLDGRHIPIRRPHAALNTLLQSGEAIAMKTVLVLHAKRMAEAGYPVGDKWHYVGNIHDEFQAEIAPELADLYSTITSGCYETAGEMLGMLCPFRGGVMTGNNWSETH